MSSSDRERQVDEVLAEVMRAIDAGQRIDERQWLSRYPEFVEELRELLAQQKDVEKLVRPIRQAAAEGLNVRCPHCHNPIELLDEALLSEISCPSCGSSFSLVGDGTVSHYQPGERTVGHFQLLDRVGVGQFGSVWRARDTKLDRTVAIKIPRNSQLDGSQAELFLRDARAAAQLKHPNIVSVHEVGKHDDIVYIVSDFIHGTTLKEWMAARRLAPRVAAQLCVKIAKALHHAHESGVIHRDLKPSNIMMDTDGEPHIVDFGLAKREAGEITMTSEGQILGTPAYMSPEQARGEGHNVDRCADVYSLGVILFESLTGELPFRGDKQMLLVQILNDESPSPRKLDDTVPRDLETICLKCMSKEPKLRYSNAYALAEDLERFLDGAPILARPIGRTVVIWKWCKRNRLVAGLGVTLLCLILTAATVSPFVAAYQATLRHRAEALVEDKQQLLGEKQTLIDRLDVSLDEQKAATTRAEREAYFAQLARVEDIRRTDPIRAHALLEDVRHCPPHLRGFTWGLFHHLTTIERLESQIHTGWLSCIRFSPDGARLVAVGDDVLMVCDARTLEIEAVVKGDFGNVRSVAFSPESDYVAFGDGKSIRLMEVEAASSTTTLEGHRGAVTSVAFSPDGTTLASASFDDTVKLWNVPTGEVAATFKKGPGRFNHYRLWSVAFSPDGELVASGGHNDTVVLWNATSGEEYMAVEGNRFITALEFLPDGNTLVSGPEIAFWDLTARTKRDWTVPQNRPWNDMALSADGKTLALSQNQVISLWDLNIGRERMVLRGDGSQYRAVDFSRVDKRLASVNNSGELHIWKLTPNPNPLVVPTTRVFDVAYAADGKTIAAAVATGPHDGLYRSLFKFGVKLWDGVTGQELGTLDGGNSPAYCVAFSKDGRSLAAAGYSGKIRVWDLETYELQFSRRHENVHGLEFSPDGSILASGSQNGTIKLWGAVTGMELSTIVAGSDRDAGINCLSFFPDGKTLIGGTNDKKVMLWDVATRELVDTLEGHESSVMDVAISPDGKVIASAGDTVRLWRVESRTETLNLRSHNGHIRCLAFSPDGAILASGGEDNSVKLWHVARGEELATLDVHQETVSCVAFAPDGRSLASGSFDESIRIWIGLPDSQILSAPLDEFYSQALEDLKGQVANIGQLIQLEPDDYYRTNAFDLVLAYFELAERLREVKPQTAEGVYRRSLEILQRLAQDLEERGGAASFTSTFVRIQGALGHLYLSLGRFKEADTLLKDAIGRLESAAQGQIPNRWWFASTYEDLGESLFVTGRLQEARVAFQNAIQLREKGAEDIPSPNSIPMNVNALAWLLATCPIEDIRDSDTAGSLAQSLISRLSRGGGNYWKTLGVAQYRSGDWVDCQKSLEKAESLGIYDEYVGFYLAMACWQLGQTEQAVKRYRDAERTDANRFGRDPRLARLQREASALLGSEKTTP